jgi:hypothetical protein
VSWSAPRLITPPSAKNKSDHSAEAEPNACPSAELGTFEAAHERVPEPFVVSLVPEEPSAVGSVYVISPDCVPT